MSDDLETLLRLFKTHRKGCSAMQRKRVACEAAANDARNEEGKHGAMIRALEPIIQNMEGGKAGLGKVMAEIRQEEQQEAAKAPETPSKALEAIPMAEALPRPEKAPRRLSGPAEEQKKQA